ncbi:MAG: hypothetical protein OEV94_07200 [Deltaproteobacteria bacterium]|nr:hypothetical protein [Deltaproteobacteria bacterium]
MSIRTRFFQLVLVFCLVAGGWLGGNPTQQTGPGEARGYQPDLTEIANQLAAQGESLNRAIVRTESRVFSPTSQERGMETPSLQKGDGFKQIIYWEKNKFLAIETHDLDGKPLYLYFEEKGVVRSGPINSRGKDFSQMDLLHPGLAFLENRPEGFFRRLAKWGIFPTDVRLERAPNRLLTFRLFDQDDGALWLDNETLAPQKLEVNALGDESPLHIVVLLNDPLRIGLSRQPEQNAVFPGKVSVLFNGRLIKQTVVTGIDDQVKANDMPYERLKEAASRLPEENPAQ